MACPTRAPAFLGANAIGVGRRELMTMDAVRLDAIESARAGGLRTPNSPRGAHAITTTRATPTRAIDAIGVGRRELVPAQAVRLGPVNQAINGVAEAPLRDAVGHILLVSAGEQMTRAHARGIVAVVTNLHLIRYRADLELITEAMNQHLATILPRAAEHAVSMPNPRTSPDPTWCPEHGMNGAVLVDLRPKPVHHWSAFRHSYPMATR